MSENLETKINTANQFKSAGERKIAEVLDKYGISFKYESPVIVIDNDSKQRIWYPDFYLPEFGLYIEFFGLAGVPSYDEMIREKLAVYRNHQIEVIPVYQKNINSGFKFYLTDKIAGSLAQRQQGFYEKLSNYSQRRMFP